MTRRSQHRRLLTAVIGFCLGALVANATSIARVYERTTPEILQPLAGRVIDVARKIEQGTGLGIVRETGEKAHTLLAQGQVVGDVDGQHYLLVGDSMMENLVPVFQRELEERGAQSSVVIQRGGVVGSPLWEWEPQVIDAVRRYRADVVVILADAQGTELEEYAEQAARFASGALDAGAERVVWLERPLTGDTEYEKLHSMRHDALQLAAQRTQGMLIVTAGSAIMPSSGAYGAHITDHRGVRIRVRDADGVHLTEQGAEIFTEAVLDRLGL